MKLPFLNTYIAYKNVTKANFNGISPCFSDRIGSIHFADGIFLIDDRPDHTDSCMGLE